MKKIFSSFLVLVFIAITLNAAGQNNSDILDLGDGKILDVKQLLTADFVIQEFKVEVKNDGNYFFAAWVNGGSSLGDGMLEYTIQVNDYDSTYKINSKFRNPHAIDLDNEQLQLRAGINIIRVLTKKPDCPNVEFIKVSMNKENRLISEIRYNKYIDELSKLKLPENYAELKKYNSEAETSISDQKSTLPNPEGNYQHEMDVDFEYSYFVELYIGSYGTITLETTNATSDPVLQLVSRDLPGTYSWTDDDGGDGYNSKIVANITFTGSYYVFIRKSPASVNGTCNLLKNGVLYASNCAVAGTKINCDKTVSEVLNWFTADLTGSSLICIENQNGDPGKIIAFNHQWTTSSDFNWGYNSRIRSNLNTSIRSVYVLSYLSYYPTGNCDLYMNCKNSTIETYFPNLKSMDAIQSAPASENYNCASWGGGRVDLGRLFWASNPPDSRNLSGPWYVAGNFWASWDNFFGNNPVRFIGAPNYTRSGANETNGEVAMWYNSTSGNYTHFSTTKPANEHPHGYDWESKPGGLMRTFHPRDALNDNTYYGYGSISLYYTRLVSALKSYTFDESVALGLTVLPLINLTDEENHKIFKLKSQLTFSDITDFNAKFETLVKKSQSTELLLQSNPVFLYETSEFKDLVRYCKNIGQKIWPFLFEKVFDGKNDISNELAAIVVNEITTEYTSLMKQVKEEWSKNCYTADGAYIAPSPMNNTRNYILKLLNLSDEKATYENQLESAEKEIIDNNDFFSLYPNPFKTMTNVSLSLKDDSNVTLKVYDMNGILQSVVINNQKLTYGKHTIEWVPNNLKSGLYVFHLNINGKKFCRRFLIE